jgi:hypothetical protein
MSNVEFCTPVMMAVVEGGNRSICAYAGRYMWGKGVMESLKHRHVCHPWKSTLGVRFIRKWTDSRAGLDVVSVPGTDLLLHSPYPDSLPAGIPQLTRHKLRDTSNKWRMYSIGWRHTISTQLLVERTNFIEPKTAGHKFLNFAVINIKEQRNT